MKSLYLNLITIILTFITFYFLFNQCTCKENMSMRENMSNLNSYPYTLNTHDNIEAGDIPLPNGILDLFYKNSFEPKCCFKPQNYSSSTGCACISDVQMKFLNERGGNNNMD